MKSSASSRSWPLVYLAVAHLLCVQIAAKPFFHFRSRQSENVLAIRPLICINKSTGESGICMFTLDCMALNGTSLGVCGDKMFFGSCCVIPPSVLDESTSNDPITSTTPVQPITTTPIFEASQAPVFTQPSTDPSVAPSEAPEPSTLATEAPAETSSAIPSEAPTSADDGSTVIPAEPGETVVEIESDPTTPAVTDSWQSGGTTEDGLVPAETGTDPSPSTDAVPSSTDDSAASTDAITDAISQVIPVNVPTTDTV